MPEAAPETEARSGLARTLRIGGRVLTGLVATGVAVVTIAAVGLLPLPDLGGAPAGVTVTPQPGEQLRVCPGGVVRLGDDSGAEADVAAAISEPDRATATIGASTSLRPLTDPGATMQGLDAAPTVLSAPPGSGVELAGAEAQSPAAPEHSGLAVAACAEPGSAAWLVGGSTVVGRTTLLVLSNPSAVDATASVRLFSEQGEVDAVGLAGINVPADSRRVVPLAGFAPGLVSPLVEVSVRGGRVVASLQQSIVRGLDAGGTDIVLPGAEAAESLVIPGVRIEDSLGVSRVLALGGWEDAVAVVRLLVPGAEGGSATVRVVPVATDGGEPTTDATSFVIPLQPGEVTDVALGAGIDAEALSALPDGLYTVYVDAEIPVVAAARAATAIDSGGELDTGPRASAPPSDFAWFSATPRLPARLLVMVAPAPGPMLSLVNPSDADATVTVTIRGSAPVVVLVPARGAASIAVDPGSSLVIEGAEGLHGSLSYAAPGELASSPLIIPRALDGPVVVHP